MMYAPGSIEYKIADKASELMGGGLRDEVIDFIHISRSSGICMHGIKNASRNLSSIVKNGIENRTPEGGMVSFWATGLQIFHTNRSDMSFFGYDTPFFHYSIGTHGNDTIKALATTTFSALKEAGISYEPSTGSPDRQITIPQAVPARCIDLYAGTYGTQQESNRDIFLKLHEATVQLHAS